jgi:hypothetical protein
MMQVPASHFLTLLWPFDLLVRSHISASGRCQYALLILAMTATPDKRGLDPGWPCVSRGKQDKNFGNIHGEKRHNKG